MNRRLWRPAATHYHLLTIWRIQAPLATVYAAILDSLRWPDWWVGAQYVKQTVVSSGNGINNVRRYAWQGELPYAVFDGCATRIERLVAIEGRAQGDLDGIGRWHFFQRGAHSELHYEWHVHSSRWWMNLMAPMVRPLLIRNHNLLMTQGSDGLARLLKVPPVDQRNIDLTKTGVQYFGDRY
ncbi:SRPBCC family protein [Rhodoferax sp. PAMC 29310]|uniref:SRPBCC family protein n=1 Tax=Rhodoferax sp. PAMC 29310 TaxID=2822760 RepID=UPI001B33BC7A|nr:SRPBCC family protein [Rhodoferax sp. PAMC 29310]